MGRDQSEVRGRYRVWVKLGIGAWIRVGVKV